MNARRSSAFSPREYSSDSAAISENAGYLPPEAPTLRPAAYGCLQPDRPSVALSKYPQPRNRKQSHQDSRCFVPEPPHQRAIHPPACQNQVLEAFIGKRENRDARRVRRIDDVARQHRIRTWYLDHPRRARLNYFGEDRETVHRVRIYQLNLTEIYTLLINVDRGRGNCHIQDRWSAGTGRPS